MVSENLGSAIFLTFTAATDVAYSLSKIARRLGLDVLISLLGRWSIKITGHGPGIFTESW